MEEIKDAQTNPSLRYVGSMELQNRQPAVNGKTDTLGSLSTCSGTSISKLESQGPKALPQISKFASLNKPRADSFEQSPVESPKSAALRRQSDVKNLHKLALKNSYIKGHNTGEERKADENSSADESEDVSEENSPLSNSINKMNFEKEMKHKPSKCDEAGSKSPSKFKR